MNGRRLLVSLASAFLLGLKPTAASTQNLVTNGDFSDALMDWRVTGEGTAMPSADDIDDDPASGSVLLGNAQVDAGTRTIPLDQCIALAGPGEYLLGASAKIDPLQVAGRAVVSVLVYEGPNCSGSIRGGAGQFVPRASGWTTVFLPVLVDIGTSMRLSLGVDKPGAGGVLELLIDDVFLEKSPLIFGSSFE